MSFNGAGLFQINSTGQPVVASTTISASVFNTLTADLATGLSTCILKDGTQTVTANIPLGGYKLTGVGAATDRTDAATILTLQNQVGVWCGTAGGSANALTLTPNPSITAYVAGQTFTFKAGASANSSTTTVAISGLSAIAVQANGAACAGGEIQANKFYRATLDSTSTCQVEPVGGVSSPAQGGTGVANNAASTITISGAYPLTATLTASTSVTLPTTGTLSTLAGSETLTNKTVNLTSNTLTGTTAQFNAALSDGDFATLAGSESLTNKKLGSLTTNGVVTTGSGDGTLSTVAPGTSGNVLTSDGSSWASSVAPSSSYKILTISRDLTAASGSVSTAHGGTGTPKSVLIFAVLENGVAASWGFSDGSTHRAARLLGTTQVYSYANIVTMISVSTGNAQEATVTLDSTNVTLNWTKSGSPSGTANLIVLTIF